MNNSLSIITICYNNVAELMETCNSIDMQNFLPSEHWVIDGSSNEEILQWLTNNPQPVYRKWTHGKDNGISDALNKGITLSQGSVIHLLHAGDKYYNAGATEEVMKYFNADNTLMWTHGLYVQHRGGIDVISGAPFNKQKLWKGMRTVSHPTMFLKKEVYERCGMFNTQYKIAMDYDLLIRIRNEKFRFIPKPLIYFSPGGASSTHFNKGLAEVKTIYTTYFRKSYKLELWQLRQKALQIFMSTAVGKVWFAFKNKRKRR